MAWVDDVDAFEQASMPQARLQAAQPAQASHLRRACNLPSVEGTDRVH